jgi:hypothetical protein
MPPAYARIWRVRLAALSLAEDQKPAPLSVSRQMQQQACVCRIPINKLLEVGRRFRPPALDTLQLLRVLQPLFEALLSVTSAMVDRRGNFRWG